MTPAPGAPAPPTHWGGKGERTTATGVDSNSQEWAKQWTLRPRGSGKGGDRDGSPRAEREPRTSGSPARKVAFSDAVDLVEYDQERPAAEVDTDTAQRRKVALKTAEEAKRFAALRQQREAEEHPHGTEMTEAERRKAQSERDKAAARAQNGKGRGKSDGQWLRRNLARGKGNGTVLKGKAKGKGKKGQRPRGRGGRQ